MNIIEYQPSTVRSRAEHRRIIRDMGRAVMYPNPITRALGEMVAAAVGCGIWVLLCAAVWNWLLCK